MSVENTLGLSRRITITIPTKIIEKTTQEKLAEVSKKVSIDGFRKGKVPVSMILQRYGTSIRQEVLDNLMTNYFINLIKQKKINLVGLPNYVPSEYKKGQDFTYIVDFEVYPEIKLHSLESIEVEKPVVKITESDIDSMIQMLQKQNATWKESNTTVKIDDRVTIDFIGLIDGKEFEGSRSTNLILDMKQNYVIPGLNDSIIDHKKGDVFTFYVKFPDDYHSQDLQGKNAKFDVVLKKVEVPQLPEITEEFIRSFGIKDGSIISFRSEIRKNIENQLKDVIRNQLKLQVINSLVKTNNIKVPEVLINDAIEVLRRHAVQKFINVEKIKATELSNELLKEQARKRVVGGILLSEVIHMNKLKADENRIKTMIEEIAFSYKNPQEIIKLYRNNKELMNNLRNIVLEDQAIEIILSQAKIVEKVINFQQLIDQTTI